MSRKKRDWPAIKREYIEGIVDQDGKRVFPAVVDIAKKYGLNYQTFRNQVSKNQWPQEREMFAAKIETARIEKRVDVLAGAAAEFDSKCLRLAEAGISHIARHFQLAAETKKPLSLAELNQAAQAQKSYQQIGRLALGESTEKQGGPPGVQINNLMAVDLSTLSEDEIATAVRLGIKLRPPNDT